MFSINIVNKGTQLNRVKGELRGTVLNSNGMLDDTNQQTLFRQLYVENGYVLLDAELTNDAYQRKNWNEEALERHKKTATVSNSINNGRKRKNTSPIMNQNKKKILLDETITLDDLTSNLLYGDNNVIIKKESDES